MTKKEKIETSAEALVRLVLNDVFHQKINVKDVRKVAKKVSAVVPTREPRHATAG
jgi:hypothetical protein